MATTSRDSVSATAPAWEQRFRASAILLSTIAIDAPDVGLVSSNASGIPQLYRWDTASGALTQLTFDEGGRIVGRLSPDGRWVTWLADTSGNEIGHWVVIPSDGSGDAIDLSPKSRAVRLGADRVQPARWPRRVHHGLGRPARGPGRGHRR